MYGQKCLEQYTWADPNSEKGGAQFTKKYTMWTSSSCTHASNARTHARILRGGNCHGKASFLHDKVASVDGQACVVMWAL